MPTAVEVKQSTTGSDVDVSTAVVESVSTATDTPALELPPLQDAVDPDALDGLFAEQPTTASVRFRYAGRAVTVHPDRTITVSQPE